MLRIVSLSENMALSKRGPPSTHGVLEVYHCWSVVKYEAIRSPCVAKDMAVRLSPMGMP